MSPCFRFACACCRVAAGALIVFTTVAALAVEERIASGAKLENALREDLQRPVDARLAKIETLGSEGCGLFTGEVHVVRSVRQVQALSGRLKPGDQLVLAGDEWKDARFAFAVKGTESAPILIGPEKPGGAVFTGRSSMVFHGEHLIIMGLEFRDAVIAQEGTVLLKLGNGRLQPANHCIVNRVKIERCNSASPEDWPRMRAFCMTVNGSGVTVANSIFADFKHRGQMIGAAELPVAGHQQLHILNNRFLRRPHIDSQNGYEIIQIGWSSERARSSGSLIEGNAFEDCEGEDEIITLKASDVFVRRNTFTRCQGAVSLREADRVLVDGNVFDGRGKKDAGGVRVAGAGHVIVGNTFRNLGPPHSQHYWPLSMMCGNVETSGDDPVGYGRVKNVLVANNRFERTAMRIAVGSAMRPDRALLPQNIHVRDNVFTGTTATSPFDFLAADPAGALARELHVSGNQFQP